MKRSTKRSYQSIGKEEPKKKYVRPDTGNDWLYHEPFWKRRREEVKHRNRRENYGVCDICAKIAMLNEAEDVDHIEPVKPGATLNEFMEASKLENLQYICKPHHSHKSATEGNKKRKK